MNRPTLFEVSWEVCNMVGGIHTVLATKVREMQARFGDDYVAVGPTQPRLERDRPVFREEHWLPELHDALAETGIHVQMGRWLVQGEPKCLLVNYGDVYQRKDEILARYWERYQLDSLLGRWDYYDPLLFAHATGVIIERYYTSFLAPRRRDAIVHCHEWMSAAAILHLEDKAPEIGTVFTTHATMLGRTLCGNRYDPAVYDTLERIDPMQTARELDVLSKHSMETVAARVCDVMTTVSEITAEECTHLLERKPDVILPNGLGDDFPAWKAGAAEHQAARRELLRIAEQVTGDRYPDETCILLTSGRYEYTNKGVDVYLKALGELQDRLDGQRVVAFALMPAGHSGPNRQVLEARRTGVRDAQPATCTHDLHAPDHDPIQRELAALGIDNAAGAAVHVVQVPIYLDGSDPLVSDTYYELLPGADLTVFPSFYEPWGYTPMESAAYGIPTITSDLAGFGKWVEPQGDFDATGVAVVHRRSQAVGAVVLAVTEAMLKVVGASRKERAALGKRAQDTARGARWAEFVQAYERAYELAGLHASERLSLLPFSHFRHVAERRVVSSTAEGDVLAHMHQIQVVGELPEALQPLRELASNLWWCWHPEARHIFEEMDPELHRQVSGDPSRLIECSTPRRLRDAASDGDLLQRMQRCVAQLRQYCATAKEPRIAYFCMEYGLSAHLKIYSGGLGVLAGDHLKTASDLGLPLCAVGLAYGYGYFAQRIDESGAQQHQSDRTNWEGLDTELLTDDAGDPILVQVGFPGRTVQVKTWRVKVGRIQLYLLDTNVESNRRDDRDITGQLYGGDRQRRLQQELVLGIGGVRMLEQIGVRPDIYHMNEGHSAFLILARANQLISHDGLKFDEALEMIRATTVFTTHTPVPAGHDHFSEELIRPYLQPYEKIFHGDWGMVLGLGQGAQPDGKFGSSELAMHGCQRINGVSAIHGGVTRRMFAPLFPGVHEDEVPIRHVTNGVHVPTWVADPWQDLFAEYLASDWRERLEDDELWARVRGLDDQLLWGAHLTARLDLLSMLREQVRTRWSARRESPSLVTTALAALDADPLIIGFARRFAPYKRADLIFSDIPRLSAILRGGSRPVVLVMAGKAHPQDGLGQDIIRRIIELSRSEPLAGHVIFVENYDMEVARHLVAGADVWLNTPTRPLEASGTSGMKAAMNGCLNLSVPDGWWAECYAGDNGWVIGSDYRGESREYQDAYDSKALYALLEGQLLPTFDRRDGSGVPRDWVAMMKASIATSVPRFGCQRMLRDYERMFYEPALADAARLSADDYESLRQLTAGKRLLRQHWGELSFGDVHLDGMRGQRTGVGEPIPVRAVLEHPSLSAAALEVQVVVGRGRVDDHLESFGTVVMKCVEDEGPRSAWEVAITLDTPGPYAIGLRVVPRGYLREVPAQAGLNLIRWL